MLWDTTDDLTGNVVFFLHYGLSRFDHFLEHLVATKTHGPYVHVGMIIGKGTYKDTVFTPSDTGKWVLISAQSDGINYSYLPENRQEWRMSTIKTLNVDAEGNVIPLDKERVLFGIEWAKMHIHTSYGWIDNVTQAIDILWPNNPLPQLVEPEHYNCSNFVVAILDKMGIQLPRSFLYPYNVSPNDIAEWLGLLPLRKRIKK